MCKDGKCLKLECNGGETCEKSVVEEKTGKVIMKQTFPAKALYPSLQRPNLNSSPLPPMTRIPANQDDSQPTKMNVNAKPYTPQFAKQSNKFVKKDGQFVANKKDEKVLEKKETKTADKKDEKKI